MPRKSPAYYEKKCVDTFGSEGFNDRPISQSDCTASPSGSFAASIGIRFGKQRIAGEFIFDVFQMRVRLRLGIRDKPNVGLATCEQFPKRKGKSGNGRFG